MATQPSDDVYALSARLDRDLAARLKAVAFQEKKSINEITSGLIRAYVERKEREWASTT